MTRAILRIAPCLLVAWIAGCRPTVSITLSPENPAVRARGTVQFSATVTGAGSSEVGWTVTEAGGGTVDASGLYTAPDAPGSYEVVATAGADPSRTARTRVTVTPVSSVTVALTPAVATVGLGGFQKFVATVQGATNPAVIFSVEEGALGGSLSSSGTYTAPQQAGTYHVLATSVEDASQSARATVEVVTQAIVSLKVTPEAATLPVLQSQQFSAQVAGTTHTAVTWSIQEAQGGTITAAGLYTAPGQAGTYHVVATSAVDPSKSSSAAVVVTAGQGVQVAVAPSSANVEAGKTLQLVATVTGTPNTQVVWSVQEGASGGTVDTSGLYTAPAQVGTYHVVATSVADGARQGSATVTVVPAQQTVAVTLSPTSASLPTQGTQLFSASVTGTSNTGVTWSVQEGASGGSVASNGFNSAVYTAPTSGGTFHVVATSVADTGKTAVAVITVAQPAVEVSVQPPYVLVAPNGTQAFSATVAHASSQAVTWAVVGGSGGAITAGGAYTAPATPGTYVIEATSVADSTAKGWAQVVVVPPGGHSIAGTVSYGGTRSGRIYVVATSAGGSQLAGTSLAAPGAFTLRGIEANGAITVRAYMDTLGIGDFNPPSSPSGVTTVTLPGAGAAAVTLTDPTASTPPVPSAPYAYGGDQMAVLFLQGVYDANAQEIADHYRIYWSTTPNAGPANPTSKSISVRAGAFVAVVRHRQGAALQNGQSYYFAVTAVAGSHESAPSGDVPVTIGPATGGVAVSGSVSWSGFAANGPLYLLAYGASGVYLSRVQSPSSPQAYTLQGLAGNAYYYLYAFMDEGDDGDVSLLDVSTFMDPKLMSVGGGGATGQDVAFASGSAVPTVTTQHTAVGAADYYNLTFMVGPNAKLPVKVAILSGPNLAGPLDVPMSQSSYHVGSLLLGGTAPSVGQTYTFELAYADGTSEQKAAQVTGVMTAFARPVKPSGSGSAQPTFEWAAPSPAPASGYSYRISIYDDAQGAMLWRTSVASSRTSVLYNEDQRASIAQLSQGQSYRWYVGVTDANGNVAYDSAAFTVP